MIRAKSNIFINEKLSWRSENIKANFSCLQIFQNTNKKNWLIAFWFSDLYRRTVDNKISNFTETTGLNLQKDQICQISAITEGCVLGVPDITGINRPNVEITNKFDIYLRPEVEFNSKASEINGMTKVIALQEPSLL
jgi:hypothetical protein